MKFSEKRKRNKPYKRKKTVVVIDREALWEQFVNTVTIDKV